MPKIFLARHGQNEDNAQGILNGHRDLPLTALGLEQADVLAKKIQSSDLEISKVFSSPLQRAYVTAEIVSDILGIDKPEKVDLLIERDFGIMTGRPGKDIAELCAPDIIQSETITYFLSPEGAETFPQLLERAQQVLKLLTEKSSGQNILVVCHGDIGKMIYAAYYEVEWRQVLTDFHFGNSDVLLLAPNTAVEDRHFHRRKQYNA